VIVVDSSVWIEAQRRPSGGHARQLGSLLDADEVALALPVRLELLAGIARRDRAAFERALSALPLIRPSDETWSLIERWVPVAADKGHRFALADLLIGALAAEIGGLVWSLDADFEQMERMKFVQRYESAARSRVVFEGRRG
jgi:predicted nucleic acid-binding protein